MANLTMTVKVWFSKLPTKFGMQAVGKLFKMLPWVAIVKPKSWPTIISLVWKLPRMNVKVVNDN